ncbi:hypothetical protein NC653_024656 [Populus alba x Populus x berolinensis]|uniref:Uncharacterized protein n=1 Tax=Populus alba x Populus x berolinensis TaxID=444605 RepID=A0AAD6M9X2_9ROSI|nr:hypothetical protein NC653_024656 [Populus alba x Populus x berolinensis]
MEKGGARRQSDNTMLFILLGQCIGCLLGRGIYTVTFWKSDIGLLGEKLDESSIFLYLYTRTGTDLEGLSVLNHDMESCYSCIKYTVVAVTFRNFAPDVGRGERDI